MKRAIADTGNRRGINLAKNRNDIYIYIDSNQIEANISFVGNSLLFIKYTFLYRKNINFTTYKFNRRPLKFQLHGFQLYRK